MFLDEFSRVCLKVLMILSLRKTVKHRNVSTVNHRRSQSEAEDPRSRSRTRGWEPEVEARNPRLGTRGWEPEDPSLKHSGRGPKPDLELFTYRSINDKRSSIYLHVPVPVVVIFCVFCLLQLFFLKVCFEPFFIDPPLPFRSHPEARNSTNVKTPQIQHQSFYFSWFNFSPTFREIDF